MIPIEKRWQIGKTMVDPPSGWMYGFPAPLQEDYAQQLKDAEYPENDIEMALKHSRYWEGDYEINKHG